MKYWHIQMHLPHGRGGTVIDTKKMLQEVPPVIGTGEWDDLQCQDFKGEGDRGLKNGDIILLREGASPVALCTVNGEYFDDGTLTNKYLHEHFRKVNVLAWYKGNEKWPGTTVGTLQGLTNTDTNSFEFINDWYEQILNQTKMTDITTLLELKKQIILQGPPGTGKTYSAKDIAESMIFGDVSVDKKTQKEKLENSGQFKLIQFHPAYSYEDFVRGITASSKNNQISYETKNRILGEFAAEAYGNFVDSHKTGQEISKEIWVKNKLTAFTSFIGEKLSSDSKFILKNDIYIFEIEDDAFRYKGDTWKYESKIKFLEFLKLAMADITERKKIEDIPGISAHVLWRKTYYFSLLEKFKEFIGKETYEKATDVKAVKLEKFIMLIDEINRANLPAVLGELIYALEYRGETVESTYDLDGDRKLILPPNLYIIGTMNTADRSVGHIDYAIRRRFAFVEVLPSDAVIDAVIKDNNTRIKSKALFSSVSSLFTEEYLAADFQAKEVQLGHSYFLADNEEILKIKLEYEIKPILREYLKDGILINGAKLKIEELSV